MKQVLFICVGNASRSAMAEAFFNALVRGGAIPLRGSPDPGGHGEKVKARAVSAGTKPAPAVGQKTVEAMAEIGFDISGHRPRLLTPELLQQADRVIGMGCGVEETCPVELGLHLHEDWGLDDTREMGIEATRSVRDEVRRRVEAMVREMSLT